jgi:hypothetical protein
MSVELRWKSSLSATCLHAVACRRAGLAPANPALAAARDSAAEALVAAIVGAGWPVDAVVKLLAGLASDVDNNQQLVTRAATRLNLVAAGAVVSRIAGAIADLEAVERRMQPELEAELAARGRPLREQWEARGPGLLAEIARLTEPNVVPEAAEIVLLAPYVGGHGAAYPALNRVVLEAVLVNPWPELPETVRLAWLLCQLQSDLPRYGEALPGGRTHELVSLAVMPAVLAAGEAVELTRCEGGLIAEAINAWGPHPALPCDAAERILAWWNAWLELPKSWPVAVAALDQMLA